MNDQADWEQAVAGAVSWYSSLPEQTAAQLNNLIDTIRQLKQNLVELTTRAGSAQICCSCGGECCRFGKYHVSVLDILAYLKNGVPLVIPDFSAHPACPYSNETGCTMPAGYRPMTCVVFNCQPVEDRLSPDELASMRRFEEKLRAAIADASRITRSALGRAALLSNR